MLLPSRQTIKTNMANISLVLGYLFPPGEWSHDNVGLQSAPYVHVAVPGRNQTLFRCVFRSHYHVRSALAQKFP